MCNYYNFKGDKCTLPALANGFCGAHQYIAESSEALKDNQARSMLSKPKTKLKAKLKASKPKIKAKFKSKPKLITEDQCQKWAISPTVNPLTGRMIKVDGPVYNKLKNACAAYGINIPSPSGSFKEVYKCGNDMDPVMGDLYQEYEDYDDLIRLGSGMCYPLDTLYEWYKSKVTSSNVGTRYNITDPMVPSYTLTRAEIDKIDKYMKERDVNYTPPQQRQPKGPPKSYRLIVDEDWYYNVGFHRIRVYPPNSNRGTIIGTLPMNVDEGGVGSYTVLLKLHEAWNQGVLTPPDDPFHTFITIFEATKTGIDNYYWWEGPPIGDPMSIPEYREAIIKNLSAVEAQLDELLS